MHRQLGGQQRGGISTPPGPFVLLFSGASGEEYGYKDEWIDGEFHYTGEGQLGDMVFARGNRAVAEHRKRGKRLLLFTERPSGVHRFEGEMAFRSMYQARRPDKGGRIRDAFIFILGQANEALESEEIAGYITSRGFRLPETANGLEKRVWFNLWRTKQWPYEELMRGDLLYWCESPTKKVVWKSRISELDRFAYTNKGEVSERIRSRLGSIDESETYFQKHPDRGYCVAMKVIAIKRLARPKPDHIRMPQLGWLRIDRGTATDWLAEAFVPREITLEDFEAPTKSLLEWLRRLNEKMGEVSPERRRSVINHTIRHDSPMIRALKRACQYTCQFPGCGVRIPTRDGGYYIEVAHIEPVHAGGKSVLGNLVVLCPNHHKELDHGDRIIEEQTLELVRGTLNGREFEIVFPTVG